MSARIRLATQDDGESLAAIYRPAVDGITSFEAVPPDAAEMAARVARVISVFPWVVCEIDGAVAGYAYASRHRERDAYRWTAEVSAYVDARVHRRGVGRALYTSLFAVLAAQGMATLVAGIALPNPASVAFHESMGFAHVGVFHRVGFKQGRGIDVAWLERHLRADETPEDPVPLPRLASDRLATCLASGLTRVRG